MSWKKSFGIALAVILATTVLLLVAVRTAPRKVEKTAQSPQAGTKAPAVGQSGLAALGVGQVSFSGSTMWETDQAGAEKWRAEFEGEASIDAKTQTATAKNVRLTVKFEPQRDMVLEAPSFEADFSARKMDFPAGSRLRVSDGSGEFSADTFTYDMDTGEILGRGNVKFRHGPFLMTGQSLRIDPRAKTADVTGDPAHFERAS